MRLWGGPTDRLFGHRRVCQEGIKRGSVTPKNGRLFPLPEGKCQKGSKWSVSGARPSRNCVLRPRVSNVEKPQVTKMVPDRVGSGVSADSLGHAYSIMC
jgi:hypothetical protein